METATRYRDGNISVDDAFVRFGSKSYAIAKLTSVEVKKEVTPPDNIYLALAIFGVLALLASIGPLTGSGEFGDWLNRALGSLFLIAVGVGLLWFSRLAYGRRQASTEYQLILNNSGSETIAYKTKDAQGMEALWIAIEDAIAEAARR